MFSSKSEEWSTPQWLFNELNEIYNFTLDPCATKENSKCKKYYTKEDDGLSKEWKGERVFCNPPYGRKISDWVEKCSEESKNPKTLIVALLSARTDTAWFHDYIYDQEDCTILFLRGRLKFGNSENSAPFPSMIVTFGRL